MTATTTTRADWSMTNQRYLAAATSELCALLEARTTPDALSRIRDRSGLPLDDDAEAIAATMDAPPALHVLERIFGLSPFERDLLLLCAAMEFEAAIGPLCAALNGDAQRAYPTFGLALAALPNAYWSALAPTAPLRRWRLIEVGAGNALTLSPLRIDERILHYLTGIRYLDSRLIGMMHLLPSARRASPVASGHRGPHRAHVDAGGTCASSLHPALWCGRFEPAEYRGCGM